MNTYHLLSFVFFILGFVFFAIGVVSGDVETGFIVVFPFLIGSGIYAFLGVICVFIAMVLFTFGTLTSSRTYDLEIGKDDEAYPGKKTSVKGGGVVLIGPIPIVFGSNWKIAVLMMILAIILIVASFMAFKYLL